MSKDPIVYLMFEFINTFEKIKNKEVIYIFDHVLMGKFIEKEVHQKISEVRSWVE